MKYNAKWHAWQQTGSYIGFYDQGRYRDEPEYQLFDPKGKSFFNANTPDDLAQARHLTNDKR